MKYTIDNLKFPVVMIGTKMIDGKVDAENHAVFFNFRHSFNAFLKETEESISNTYGEHMKKEVTSYENYVLLFYHDGTKNNYEKWRIYPIEAQRKKS